MAGTQSAKADYESLQRRPPKTDTHHLTVTRRYFQRTAVQAARVKKNFDSSGQMQCPCQRALDLCRPTPPATQWQSEPYYSRQVDDRKRFPTGNRVALIAYEQHYTKAVVLLLRAVGSRVPRKV